MFMDKWIRESQRIAKECSYLDMLLDIYPPEDISREINLETISPEFKEKFQKFKSNRESEENKQEFIKYLLNLKKQGLKFPIEHPYIGFLLKYEEAISKNPQTISLICEKLYGMEYDDIKEKMEAPKKASRRMGPMFQAWLKKNFLFGEKEKFEEENNSIIFLNGTDKVLKNYAEKNLKCKFGGLCKSLDFITKKKGKFIIGTAKFITDSGGSQSNQFNEAINFLKIGNQDIIKVVVIDGVVWLEDNKLNIVTNEIKKDPNKYIFSVLILKKFLENLRFKKETF